MLLGRRVVRKTHIFNGYVQYMRRAIQATKKLLIHFCLSTLLLSELKKAKMGVGKVDNSRHVSESLVACPVPAAS